MIIPKTLKIGGHIITVELKETDEDSGYTEIGKNKIVLDKDMEQSQLEATLIHEIFHCLNTTFTDKNFLGHSVISSLAEQFYQVLKDNKLLK
jgi:hypothetical protein